MKVGEILHHTTDNKNLGVIIHEFPDKLLLFRVDNNTHPTFSKILKQNIHQVVEIGNINQHQFQDIKQHLLKYYRTRNITDTEEKLLKKIMTYAFPNGIPLYNSTELPTEESLSEYKLVDKLIPGECFYLNTTKYTPFPHLDNQQTYVMEHNNKGIWMCLHKPTSSTPIYSFLPYLNKDLGTFHGISKVIPSSKDEKHYQIYQEDFSKRKEENSLFSQIEANETKCKVQPESGNKVIVPHQYQGQYYDFKSGKIHNSMINHILDFEERVKSGKVDSASFDNDFDFSNTKKPDTLSMAAPVENLEEDQYLNQQLSDKEMAFIDNHQQVLQGGASKKEDTTLVEPEIESETSDEEYLEEEDLHLLKGLDMKRGRKLLKKEGKEKTNKSKGDKTESETTSSNEEEKESGTDSMDTELSEDEFSETEFDESQLELFEEDDIVVIGTETKMQQLPVPELEKTFKDDIQRGRIMKQKIEKLPSYKRNNPLFIMDLEKEVNVINIMKNEVTKTDKSPFIPSSDFKPLVESYLQKDFTNPFLIPLVINRKKLYLTPKDGVSVDDFNKSNTKVYENFYKLLQQENERNPIDRKQTIRIDESLKQKISDHTPFLTHENNLGLLIRLGEGIHPDNVETTNTKTNKSKNTRNKENVHRLQQETLTIRYGEKPFTIENFSATSKMFDAQVQLGPLGRYIKPDKSQITQEDLERMEMETDKYTESVYSDYHVYYYGDAIHMIGFVRPPLNYFLSRDETFNNGDSLIDNLNKEDEKDKVIVKYLNKLPNPEFEDLESDTQALDEPDKFVLYLFPGINRNGNINAEKCNINNTKLEQYLNDIIPTIKDISTLFSKNNSSVDTEKINDILEKFDYVVPSRGVNYNSQLVKINEGEVSYQQYKEVIKPLEDDYLRKLKNYNSSLNRMLKLGALKKKKQGEKDQLLNNKKDNNTKQGNVVTKVVTNDIIELADKVFPEKLEDLLSRMTGELAKSDGFRLDYYSRQVDRGEYMELLLRKRFYLQLEKEMDIEKLENTLSLLKAQYESMQGDLEKLKLEETQKEKLDGKEGNINVVKVCKDRLQRKPKILTYPSLERLQQDNGRTITNDKGEIIGSGDYAFLNIEGEKTIFKREELSEGDYWIQQPLETLRDLLMKKQRSCEDKDEDSDAKMLLTGEKADGDNATSEELDSCRFDIEELQCAPPMLVEKEFELKEVEKRLNDTASQIAFGKVIPQILSQIEKDLHKTEKQIVNYFKNDKARISYETKKRLDAEKLLENTIYQKQPCTHYKVVDYIEGLTNITPMEKYSLMKQIMDEFQNNEQVATLELNNVSNEPKENYAECFQCQQNLVCKHYYYAIDLMRHDENGELDEDQLIKVFGVESVGSYHCKVCGVFLATTEIKDMEEFAKGPGKEGFHMKTREVRDGINIIERQKQAVTNIIKDTLFGVGKDDKKDLEMKLRIFRLGKDLINLEILNMDDELEMFNFMKTANFTSKKVFFNQIFLLLKKSGKPTNTNVINQLAENKYWQYATCDILGRLLITLQTSRKVYPTYNKLCNSNYMGYPLTSDTASGVENMNGINLMVSVMKQMSLLKDFSYLGSDAKGFEGLKTLLKSRIDFLVNNDEFIRSKLEKALDEKYNTITFDKELENSPTNYWATFQPNLSLSTVSRWTPGKELDDTALKNWKGDNVYNMLGVARENLEYHADLIIRNLKKIVGEMTPLTRLTLDTSIGNACCPIYIPTVKKGLIEKEIISMSNDDISKGKSKSSKMITDKMNQYINPKISSDKYLIGKNVAIGNSIRKINEYYELSKKLERQLALDSIKFNFINKLRVTRDDIPFNLNLSSELLRMYFNKYIYSGLFKGETYLFNAFGRCLISNELKADIEKMNFTQTDFEKLFHFVNVKNSKVDTSIPSVMEPGVEMINTNNEECIVVNNLVKILNTWLHSGLKHIVVRKEVITNVERLQKQVVEAIQSNVVVEMSMFPSFMEEMGNMIDEYTKLWNVCSQFDAYLDCFSNKGLQKEKGTNLNTFISMSLEEVNKNMYGICLDNLKIKVLPKEVFNEKQTMFQIINMIDSITMDTITEIVDAITDVNGKGKDNEDILLSVGDYPDLVKDYITHLDEQNTIRPNINYQNNDALIENFKNTKKLDTVVKIIKDITTIVNTIKNNSWSGLRNTDDVNIHMRDFFTFKDNDALFGKLSSVSNILRNVVSHISNTGKQNINIDGLSSNYLFNSEFSSKLGNMCLIWMLNDYLSIVENKKVITLQEMEGGEQDNTDFNINRMLDIRDGEKREQFETMKSEYQSLQGGNYGMIEMDKDELDYYPELQEGGMVDTLENYEMLEGGMTNEPGEQIGSGEEDLNSRLKTVKSSQKKVIISFIEKCLAFMKEYTRLYNEMNIGRIEARIAKENERQTRANLDAWIRTSAEGREEDRMVINNLMAIGAIEYKDLNRIENEMFDDNFVGEEIDEREDGPSIRHGLDEFEEREMGFVGEAEDMEEMDYGYIGVD